MYLFYFPPAFLVKNNRLNVKKPAVWITVKDLIRTYTYRTLNIFQLCIIHVLIGRNKDKILLVYDTNEILEQVNKLLNFGKSPQSEREAIQPSITCSKLTIETLEKGVKYVQS